MKKRKPVLPPTPVFERPLVDARGYFEYDPHLNPKVISIHMLDDGSWVGETNRFGSVVKVREISPEYCLIRLMTHDGK